VVVLVVSVCRCVMLITNWCFHIGREELRLVSSSAPGGERKKKPHRK